MTMLIFFLLFVFFDFTTRKKCHIPHIYVIAYSSSFSSSSSSERCMKRLREIGGRMMISTIADRVAPSSHAIKNSLLFPFVPPFSPFLTFVSFFLLFTTTPNLQVVSETKICVLLRWDHTFKILGLVPIGVSPRHRENAQMDSFRLLRIKRLSHRFQPNYQKFYITKKPS